MSNNPSRSWSSSSSTPVFPEPPQGSLAQKTANALLKGLTRSTQSYGQHYDNLPDGINIPDLPADAYNPYPEGFNLGDQMQNARTQPGLAAGEWLRKQMQGAGGIGMSNRTRLGLQGEMQQRAQGQGEMAAQNYVHGMMPTLSSHKLGAYGLQGQREKWRLDQSLGRMGIASANYGTDASRASGFGGPLASLLGSKMRSRSSSGSVGAYKV